MTVIHSVGNITVKKQSNNTYSITNDPFFVEFLSADHFHSEEEDKDIHFRANSILTLPQYLTHTKNINNEFCMKMVYDLGEQILFMERNNRGFLNFNLEDIIVIDHHFFLFLNPEIYPLTKQLEINHPFVLSEFSAPELEKIKELPATASHKTVYYSLASIILYCLRVDLETLFPSKLYFFLERCLKEDPNDRIFLSI